MTPTPALPGVLGIHHVAFAVTNLDAATTHWQGLGAHVELRARVPSQGVDAVSLQWHGYAPTLLELIAPVDESSGVARFIERRGEGMHHVAWAVEDIQVCLDHLARAGVRVIDDQPREGLHGTRVAFIHPAAMGGVLTELVEVPRA